VTLSNLESNAAARNDVWGRVKNMNRLFLWTVFVPTVCAVLYFTLFASDIYVSESRFVVRSPQRQTQSSLFGALLQGTGFSRAQDDTYPVIDYIESRDALAELNRDGDVSRNYGEQGDWLSRFGALGFDKSFESLWKYYSKHIVHAELDSTSSIVTLQTRAYTADEAQKLNAQLLSMSEDLVNRLNERAATDSVQYALAQVDEAEARAKKAATALAAYRRSNVVFDPDRQSALQLQQVTALQTQLFAAQTQLTQLQVITPNNPQVKTLEASIATLKKQIATATGGVVGQNGSLADKSANYTALQLDAQYADRQVSSALAALDSARMEAQRKQLYLERLVQPNRPDIAIEPKRLRSIFEVFAIGVILWGILSLLVAGVKEHHD
jgi:capsular polysaccharide transport system permease protein